MSIYQGTLVKKLIYPLALAGLLAAGTAAADGFALGAKAGTLGLGLEGTKGLTDKFNLRLGLNSYSYEFDEDASGIRYDAEFDLKSTAAIIDWHPFSGSFRLSAGFVHNKNQVTLTARPSGNVTIGNTVYSPAAAGTISGDVKFKSGAPYAGIGFGNAVSKGVPFGVTFEVGVLFQGSPDVSLRSNSPLVSESDLRREEQEAEADLEDFKTYPVISLGISYRF